MDYCLPENQIGTFEDGGGGSGSVSTRNIDCVTLDADTVICTNLTIDGVEVDTELQHIVNATQNQSATSFPQETVFTGDVVADELQASVIMTDDIQAPSGTLTILSPVTTSSTLTTTGTFIVNNTTATGTTTLTQLFAPNQTSGNTTMQIGRNATSNNSLSIQHFYTSSGSTSNYGKIALTNQNGPEIYSTYVNIPNELRIQNNITNPRQVGTLTTMSGAGPFNFNFQTTLNIQKIVVSICDMNIGTAANGTPYLRWGTNGVYPTASGGYTGFNWGNNGNSTISWGNLGIPLWNSLNLMSSPTSYFISGTIEFTYAGLDGGFQRWTVKGYIGTPNAPSGAGPYYVFLSGNILTRPSYVTLNGIQIAKNAVNFTSGYCNVLYY
jgi:hypothetical protein